MNRQEITRQIKLATLVSLAKCCELLSKFCLKANTFFFKCDVWLTSKSSKYRRVFL